MPYYQKANPIADAIEAYGAIKGIQNRDKLMQLEQDERAYNRSRQAKQDVRADEQYAMQQEEIQKKKDIDKFKAVLYYTAATPENVDPISAMPPELADYAAKLYENEPTYIKYLQDPEYRKQQAEGLADLQEVMKTAATQSGPPDMNRITKGLNLVYADELNKGVADDGKPALKKELVKIAVSEDGTAFSGVLKITRQDGTTYEQILTEGRDSSPDAPMKWIPIQHVALQTKIRQGLLDRAKAKLIGMGDEATFKEFQEEEKQKKGVIGFNKAMEAVPDGPTKKVIGAILGAVQEGSLKAEVADNIIKAALPEKKARKLMKMEGGVGKGGAKQDLAIDEETGEVVYTAPAVYPKPDKSGDGDGGRKMTEVEKRHWDMFENARKQYDKLAANVGKKVTSTDEETGKRTTTTVTEKDLAPLVRTMQESKAALIRTGHYVDPEKKQAVDTPSKSKSKGKPSKNDPLGIL